MPIHARQISGQEESEMQKKRGIRRGLTLLLAVLCAQTALVLGGCASDAPEKTESGSTAVTTAGEDSKQSDTKKTTTTTTATASKKTSTTQKTTAAASGSPSETKPAKSSSRNDAAPSGEQDAERAGEAEEVQTPAGVQAEEGELPVLTDAAKNSGGSSKNTAKQTEPHTDAPVEESVIELPFVPAE